MNKQSPRASGRRLAKALGAGLSIAALALMGVGSASAAIIDPGSFGMKYTDNTYTDFTYEGSGGLFGGTSGLPNPPGYQGTENIWGIISLTGTHTLLDNNPENNALSGVSYFNNGDDGKYYFGVYGGLTLLSDSGTATNGQIRLKEVSPGSAYLNIYETTDASAYDTALLAGPNTPGGGALGSFGAAITSGTLFLSTTFSTALSAYDAGYQAGELELIQLSSVTTGSATSYLTITGGSGASLFEKDVFPISTPLPGWTGATADLKVISDLTAQTEVDPNTGLPVWNGVGDWTTNSQDPVTGVGATIPEPATLLLMGTGLLGFAARKRLGKGSTA
jgi:hypothetical protein